MFFLVSKLFAFVFMPSHVLVWLVVATAVLLALRLERAVRPVGIAAAAFFVLTGLLPLNIWLLRPLEDREPRPSSLPRHVDGVLELGGGLSTQMIESRGTLSMEETETRVTATFELARRYPNARVVFTGGSGELAGSKLSEAPAAKFAFAQLGLDPRRLLLEGKSRNTWENFRFSRDLVKPRPGEVWILVTSAWHMPRAIEIANQVGWKMIPWPSDYITPRSGSPGFFDVARNLDRTDIAFHEWLGLLAYQLTGKARSGA